MRVDLATLGVRFMVWAAESGGGFSLVEHPIPPRGLCTPLHRHTHEDEYSFVLEINSPGGFEPVHRRARQRRRADRCRRATAWSSTSKRPMLR
jgi:hypothetical protein